MIDSFTGSALLRGWRTTPSALRIRRRVGTGSQSGLQTAGSRASSFTLDNGMQVVVIP